MFFQPYFMAALLIASLETLAFVKIDAEPLGLNILFRSDVQFQSFDRAELHKQLGFKLAYQAPEMGLDFVLPRDKKLWVQGVSYEQLCGKYLKLPLVRSCSVEYKRQKKVDQNP